MDGSPRFRCVLSASAASTSRSRAGVRARLSTVTTAHDRRRHARRRRRFRALDRAGPSRHHRPVAIQPHAARGKDCGAAARGPASRRRARWRSRPWPRARPSRRRATIGCRCWPSIARAPGFPRALARTFGEVRLTGLGSADVREGADTAAKSDLSHLHRRGGAGARRAAVADRARLFEVALEGVPAERALTHPLILLDIDLGSPAEEAFARALAAAAHAALATAPVQDERRTPKLGSRRRRARGAAPAGGGDLDSIQAQLFSEDSPPQRASDGSFEFFSAPGEGRECVEIARRVLREARRGVAFDEMAVLVRAPAHYLGLLEHALAARRRAGLLRARHAAPACRAAARFWRCLPAPPRGCRPTGSPSTCRSASCPRRRPGAGVGAAGRRGVRRGLRCRGDAGARRAGVAARAGARGPAGDRRHAADAAAVGMDARRGRRDRRGSRAVAAAAARASPRNCEIRLEESRRADPESSLTQHSNATWRGWRTWRVRPAA